jgi:hypothetical protein
MEILDVVDETGETNAKRCRDLLNKAGGIKIGGINYGNP